MTQMMSFSTVDAEIEPGQPAGATAAHLLRRPGRRPLRFEGVELGMAMSFMPGAPLWFEINVFRVGHGGFVACVKRFHRDEDESDFCRAWECTDFEAVMTALESYDPAADLRVEADPEDPALALPDLAAKAYALRAKAAEARRQYAGLVGEILHDLEHGG